MINNNELFQNTIKNYPPQYELGDLVNTSSGMGYISSRVFNEREKRWKYGIRVYALNMHLDDVNVTGKVIGN